MPEALKDVAVDLSAEAAKYSPKPLVVADLPPDHIGGLTYTGGTTGKPKGVIGTTGNIATMTSIQLAEWEWPENPRFLMCTPLSHAGAAFFTPTVVKGGSMFVLGKFDPAEVLKVIEEQRITATMLVPSMLYALMDHPDSQTRDLSSLETVYYGASAINPVRLAEAIRRFGPIFAQYYGQSEAPMAITYLAKADHDEKRLTSCGRPTLFARVALLSDDGKPVPQGEPGEICVSGPLLAGGYWHLPEATADTFKDGWLHTGDMAREDEDGFYFIVDRVKDMIVSGGENIYSTEVEDALATHRAVEEVAVFGVPDPRWGETVYAVVFGRTQVTPDELIAHCRERIAGFKVPRYVELRTEPLPKSAAGKILKRDLRERHWAGQQTQISGG
ncbi:MAG TPA: AMP-binding protein [Streptosporangiaceae bacterium]|nr:AMP-binding protein [Streptosporangiaceae bacterium]